MTCCKDNGAQRHVQPIQDLPLYRKLSQPYEKAGDLVIIPKAPSASAEYHHFLPRVTCTMWANKDRKKTTVKMIPAAKLGTYPYVGALARGS